MLIAIYKITNEGDQNCQYSLHFISKACDNDEDKVRLYRAFCS